MSDSLKTIRISELPATNTIKTDDVFLLEDDSITRKITGADLLSYIKNYTESNSNYVAKSSIGTANGVVPLNGSSKIDSKYINFGTATGAVYDGGKGEILRQDFNTHVSDSVHHSHSNKSVLDTITQAKIKAWDSGTGGSGSGISSLTDLGITASTEEINKLDGMTATKTELNYSSGLTGNIQTQINNKSASTHNHDNTYAQKEHSHPASQVTSGTFSDIVVAATSDSSTYTTPHIINSVITEDDPGVGTSVEYVNGTIIHVYQ